MAIIATVDPPGRRVRKVLIITGDPLGEKLAGPAIRAMNFAEVLAEDGHEVRLLSLQPVTLVSEQYEVTSVSTPKEMEAHESWADVIVIQGSALVIYPRLAKTLKYLVVDVYDPMHLEQLEQGRGLSSQEWSRAISGANAVLNHQLRIGDFFLAASDRQRHFWLGALASLGRINIRTYQQDVTLKALIDIVPFGLQSTMPIERRPALRGVIPGINAQSKILIWAGGIYDWFDPLTLVRAVGKLAETHPELCLFFMGTRHPHPGVPEMDVIAQTRQLSEELGLTGRNVFFNDSWVDYLDRHNFLLEADAGVTTHFEHVETVFSFRTRILDYFWAGLPVISTRGDSFADLIESEGLGITVPEQDVESLARAIETVLFDQSRGSAMRESVEITRARFTWQEVAKPLRDFCESPSHAADRVDLSNRGTITRASAPRSRAGRYLRAFRRAFVILGTRGPRGLLRAIRGNI